MDADKALTRMVRDELGGYGLTVRRFGARKLFAAGTTAQVDQQRLHKNKSYDSRRHQLSTLHLHN
jgi:hypothetical protein